MKTFLIFCLYSVFLLEVCVSCNSLSEKAQTSGKFTEDPVNCTISYKNAEAFEKFIDPVNSRASNDTAETSRKTVDPINSTELSSSASNSDEHFTDEELLNYEVEYDFLSKIQAASTDNLNFDEDKFPGFNLEEFEKSYRKIHQKYTVRKKRLPELKALCKTVDKNLNLKKEYMKRYSIMNGNMGLLRHLLQRMFFVINPTGSQDIMELEKDFAALCWKTIREPQWSLTRMNMKGIGNSNNFLKQQCRIIAEYNMMTRCAQDKILVHSAQALHNKTVILESPEMNSNGLKHPPVENIDIIYCKLKCEDNEHPYFTIWGHFDVYNYLFLTKANNSIFILAPYKIWENLNTREKYLRLTKNPATIQAFNILNRFPDL